MSVTTPASARREQDHRNHPRSMKLAMLSIDQHGLIHVSVQGSITAADFPAGSKDPFDVLLGANWRSNRVLLDFGSVAYIDSCAIGWLMIAHRAFRDGGGKLIVHSIQPAVRQIFDLLNLGRAITLADNETAARVLATGGAA
jgi:anti-anti-sigma factor